MYVQKSNFGNDSLFAYQFKDIMYNFPQHIHQLAELVLMQEGELTVTVGDRSEKLKAGQFAFIFPLQMHGYYSDSATKLVIYTFSPSIVPDFFEGVGGKVGERSVFDASPATLKLFEDRLINESDLSSYSVRSCLYSVFCDFASQVSFTDGITEKGVLNKIISYMNANFKEPLSLTELANNVGYSSNYLSHCISKNFGFNYSTLLACLRVEHAKSLLSRSEGSILDIALECGFGSERSFHRHFRAITGRSPSNYRAERQFKVFKRID